MSGAECGWSINLGWQPLLYTMLRTIDGMAHAWGAGDISSVFRVAQVKEKFGVLRVYWEYLPPEGLEDWQSLALKDAITSLVRGTQAMTGSLCECCGEPGSIDSNGWTFTLCDWHQKLRAKGKLNRMSRSYRIKSYFRSLKRNPKRTLLKTLMGREKYWAWQAKRARQKNSSSLLP